MEDPLDVEMEIEDLIDLPASGDAGGASENKSLHNNTICELSVANSLATDSEFKEVEFKEEILEKNEDGVGNADQNIESTTVMQMSVELDDTFIVKEGSNSINPTMQVGNGISVNDGTPLSNHKRDASSIRSHDIDDVSGVKKPRITLDEPQASVHVNYNSLTRDSKRKLEELLQKWSEWHSRQYSSSPDTKDELESGERTYFPALHVGAEKSSAVVQQYYLPMSFWIDGETKNLQSNEFVELENNSIPLYDREYSFGLTSTDGLDNPDSRGLEIGNAPRCFNCGSYNHSLKECPKPRDNAAVNSARKQLKTRRNQNGISRNPTRYYQDTPGGKFDGLRPGSLDAETRRLLGLGELDPPPWLNRMREIGYPPGYLDPEVEEVPSGITIFGGDDEEKKIITQVTEDGEIFDADQQPEASFQPSEPEPLTRKMSVEFPGINGPIPEKADEWRWGPAGEASRSSRVVEYHNNNNNRNILLQSTTTTTESKPAPHYNEQRWSMDDGPPGVDPTPRYSSPPSYGGTRYGSDRGISSGRRSPLFQETSFHHHDYSQRSDNNNNNMGRNDRWGGFSPPGRDEEHSHRSSGRRF